MDDPNHVVPMPTHRCTNCGALWARGDDWQLLSYLWRDGCNCSEQPAEPDPTVVAVRLVDEDAYQRMQILRAVVEQDVLPGTNFGTTWGSLGLSLGERIEWSLGRWNENMGPEDAVREHMVHIYGEKP